MSSAIGPTRFARRVRAAVLSLAIAAMALAGCDIPALSGLTAGDDSKTGFNIDFASSLNRRLSEVVGSSEAILPANCLPSSRNDQTCVLVRTPGDLPACPFAQRIEACLAIEIRAALLTHASVAQIVEHDTETYCAYALDPNDPRHPGVVQVIGCSRPSAQYRLFYGGHPTLCVIVVDDLNVRTEIFAVKDGRRVPHRWCDRFRS